MVSPTFTELLPETDTLDEAPKTAAGNIIASRSPITVNSRIALFMLSPFLYHGFAQALEGMPVYTGIWYTMG